MLQGLEIVWERDGIEYRLNILLVTLFVITPICIAVWRIVFGG